MCGKSYAAAGTAHMGTGALGGPVERSSTAPVLNLRAAGSVVSGLYLSGALLGWTTVW